MTVLDLKLTFFTHKAWFHLSGHISAQNSRYWDNVTLRQTFEVLLHDMKIGVWCAITATLVGGPIFYEQNINSELYVSDILWPIFMSIMEENTWLFYARWCYSTYS
jgi:hypothetical protein